MKVVPIAILGLVATVGAATRGGAAHTSHSTTPVRGVAAHAGTVTIQHIVQRSTGTALVLERADTAVFELNIPTNVSIAVGNQGRISGANLRSGDQLVLQRNGGLADASQRVVTLSGVVGYAPISNSDVMTVQISSARTILVDVDPTTRFSDVTGAKTSLVDIVDADIVSVHGVLDTTLDEVVSTQGVVRSGPKISRSYSST